MSLPIRTSNLTRQTRFSFTCNRCLSCCRNKKIQINPYEISRLAHNRGIATSEFTRSYTQAGGTLLKWEEDGTCVFLGPKGCEVHPDRPLVCRLYPLGRHISMGGGESFSKVEPDPGCTGCYGEEGSVEDYIEAQGTGRFIEAAAKYLELFMKLYLMTYDRPENKDALVSIIQGLSGEGESGSVILMDVDGTVDALCREAGRPFPEDVEEKIALHIQAVEAWADSMKRS